MQCKFQVGQKVVCVVSDRRAPEGVIILGTVIEPELGRVYTIRKILLGEVRGVACLALEEIPDQRVDLLVNGVPASGDVAFEASGFRPLVERGTHKGMLILRELLNKQPHTVREDA